MMNDLTASLQADQLEVWNRAMALARTCDFEEEHSLQVTRLALRLFDDLTSLHRLGEEERFQLQLAGLLHDIGWIEGWKKHHKSSLNIILTSAMLPFENRDRLMIGSICRYHRRALPNAKHDHFAALAEKDRQIVTRLAAILRVADGLDRTHRDLVRDLKAEVNAKTICISCRCTDPAEDEQREALNKGNLIEKTFHRKLTIQWMVE